MFLFHYLHNKPISDIFFKNNVSPEIWRIKMYDSFALKSVSCSVHL